MKKVIKLRVARYSHAGLLAFANTVVAMMTGNPNYTTPSPALIALGTLITAFSDALTAWGPVGNRGSHVQHLAVLSTRDDLEVGLTSLANYCENTTPYDADAFASGGWEVKRIGAPLGVLPAPPNVRVIFSKDNPNGSVRLRWGTVTGAGMYRLFRSVDGGVTYVMVTLTTRASFLDTGLDSTKVYQYVVQALGAAGVGVDSDVCIVQPVMKSIS